MFPYWAFNTYIDYIWNKRYFPEFCVELYGGIAMDSAALFIQTSFARDIFLYTAPVSMTEKEALFIYCLFVAS